jgi:hypothetical protein
MTEIQAGNNFSVSTRFMQEMHKAASDNNVDAKELARLVQVASEDASGLTDDETAMLASLYTKKLDTSGLTSEEQALFNKIQGGNTSQEVVDQNIQELKSVTAHENDPNSLNFSKLKLVTESKSFLSHASFGLFGGTNQTSHTLSISDGNIPTISNPTQTTGMEERHETDRNNLVNMLVPLEQELKQGLANDSDVRKRLGASLGLDPNSAAVTQKINDLTNKIDSFKADPKKGDWTTSSDLTALMNSYAQNPPTDNPRINSAYMSSLLGTFWNATDSSALQKEQSKNFEAGDIQTPASVEEINKTLNDVNELASTDAQAAIDKASTLITQLDELKVSDPELFQKVIRGTDESAIDLLRGQVSDLKQHLKDGGTMGPAQMNQLNNISANLHQLGKTLDVAPPKTDTAAVTSLQVMIDNPDIPEEAKASMRQQLADLQAHSSSLPAESQAKLDAINKALADAKSAVYGASSSSQDSASSRSEMVNELQQAESTLTNLLSQYGISDAGRAQLQTQLDATRAALTQLKNNQDVKFDTPEQQANFDKVLQNLQKMKPAPVASVPETTPVPTTAPDPVVAPTTGGSSDIVINPNSSVGAVRTDGTFNFGLTDPMDIDEIMNNSFPKLTLDGDFGVVPVVTEPDLFDLTSGNSSLFLNPQPSAFSLGYSGVGGVNSVLGGASLFNDPFSLYSPSVGFGGFSGGINDYGFCSPSLSFPSYTSFLSTPSSSSGSGASTTDSTAPAASAPRPSLANAFLEGVGEDPANVKPLSPEQEQRKAKALDTIAQIEANGSDDAKMAAAVMKNLLENPDAKIPLPNGLSMTPPEGSFESCLSVLETYQDLKSKGIEAPDAEVVFMLAAQGMQSGQSPASISDSIAQIAKSGTKEQITENLKTIRSEKFVANQENVSEIAGKLKDSELINQLASNVLRDDKAFLGSVQKLPGGENKTTVEDALAFLRESGLDTEPSYVSQLTQNPKFAEQNQILLDTATEKARTLNRQATALVEQVQQLDLPRAQNVRSVDDAILLLTDSPSPENEALLQQLRSVKKQTDELAPQIAGIQQLNAVSENFTAVQKQLSKSIDDLRALPEPHSAVTTANIKMLTGIQTELLTKGKLSSASARLYGDYKAGRQINALEAAFNSFSSEGQDVIKAGCDAFRSAGTLAEKDAAFNIIKAGLASGKIPIPNILEHQNDVLQALGLTPATQVLNDGAFLALINAYNPSEVIDAVVHDYSALSSAHNIASSFLTGKPPAEEIAGMDAAFVSSAMDMNTGPAALLAQAKDNPVAAALLGYNQATEDVRQRNYSLPPEQQAAAWGQTLTDYQASNAIINAMDSSISASLGALSKSNDQYMVATGNPPLSESSEGPAKANLSQEAQALVDKADELANAILSPKPGVDGKAALSDLLKEFLDNIRNLDFETRKIVMAQFAKRLMNNMITKMYDEKNRENAKYHEKSLDQFKARMKEGVEKSLAAAEAKASNGQAVMAVSGQLGAQTGAAVDGASGISDQALRDDFSQFLEPAVQDGVLSRVQKQKILQGLFEGSSVTGQEGVMSILNRFQQLSSIITQ